MDSERTESELLQLWQAEQDPEALDELMRREIGILRRRLENPGLPGRPSAASRDDVAQEAALRLLAADAPRFSSRAALQGYLWSTARNLLIDRLRSARVRFQEIRPQASEGFAREPTTKGSLDGVESRDMAAALELALHLLKPDDQAVLRAVYFQGRSLVEAAQDLGLTREVVNTRLVRARMRLAEKLGKWRDLVAR